MAAGIAASMFTSQFGVDVGLHEGLLRSSRINIEPIYLYCSDFAGGAQCTLEFPVAFECSPGSRSKADRRLARPAPSRSFQVAGRSKDEPGSLDLTKFDRHHGLLRFGYNF
jgi:hypothetical protein